jgi:primase-polymerase (primpol)-like protein
MKSKRKFIEGSKVDLISGNLSAMTTGKYKFFTNKVECSWFDIKSGEIKLKYLNENTLKEHVNAPQQNYIAKPSNHY